MLTASRAAAPRHLTWRQSDGVVRDHYWLHVETPKAGTFIDAERARPTPLLDDLAKMKKGDARLVDMAKPFTVITAIGGADFARYLAGRTMARRGAAAAASAERWWPRRRWRWRRCAPDAGGGAAAASVGGEGAAAAGRVRRDARPGPRAREAAEGEGRRPRSRDRVAQKGLRAAHRHRRREEGGERRRAGEAAAAAARRRRRSPRRRRPSPPPPPPRSWRVRSTLCPVGSGAGAAAMSGRGNCRPPSRDALAAGGDVGAVGAVNTAL